MKLFFTIICAAIALISFGCAHHPQIQEELPYTKAEVDLKIDSLRDMTQKSFRVMQSNIEEIQQIQISYAGQLNQRQKNITQLAIPQDVTFCGISVPMETLDGRMRFEQELFFLFARQDYLILYMLRANQWFPDVERLLADSGLSNDLKYVPVGESGLRANARSADHAQGWWQFISATGRKYGLLSNGDIDMRNNLIASTNGAILYFKDLLDMFGGDYALALAGYNMGENGLRRRIRDQKTSNYFELELSYETSQYVFRMAAIKYALEHPLEFGIDPEAVVYWEPFAFDTVTVQVRFQLPLNDVVAWTNSTMREIKRLNPEVKSAWPRGTYLINLPLGTRSIFFEELSRVKKK